MMLKPVLGGIKSYIPLPLSTYKGTGGTLHGRYCYSVWLRHLTLIRKVVPRFEVGTLVEFGPGDSIGTGIAALLSGTHRYYALDVLEHANCQANLSAFDDLVRLFHSRARLPDDMALPGVYPRLESYEFANTGIRGEVLEKTLRPERIEKIRVDLASPEAADAAFKYVCPWVNSFEIPHASVDLVMGQVALQDMSDDHNDDVLTAAFKAASGWLRKGGLFSQQIDFSMPSSPYWNDHWTYPDPIWKIVRGRRPYYPNRAPLSRYISLCKMHSLRVVTIQPVLDSTGTRSRRNLSARFRSLSKDDLVTRAAYILAIKES